MSDSTKGYTGSVTIDTIVNSDNTLTASGTGSLSNGTVTYDMSQKVDLIQSSDTQLQVSYVTGGSTADGQSLGFVCTGTLTK